MTNETNNAITLRELMRVYGVNSQKVADLLQVSIYSVRAWLIHSGSEKYRPMTDRNLKMLKLVLRGRKKFNK